MVERILGWYSVTSGLRAVNLRYFNAAGASEDGTNGEDWTHSQNLVPLVMKATLGKRPPVEVFGTDYPTPDGTGIRDYVHVDDLAVAHMRALDYLRAGGDSTTLNLGTGVGTQRARGHSRHRARQRPAGSVRRGATSRRRSRCQLRRSDEGRQGFGLDRDTYVRRHHSVGVALALHASRGVRSMSDLVAFTIVAHNYIPARRSSPTRSFSITLGPPSSLL